MLERAKALYKYINNWIESQLDIIDVRRRPTVSRRVARRFGSSSPPEYRLQLAAPTTRVGKKIALLRSYKISDEDIIILSALTKYLQPFYRLTITLSIDQQPTIHKALATYVRFIGILGKDSKKYLGTEYKSADFDLAIKLAKEKVGPYYTNPDSKGRLVFGIGAILDPRVRLSVFDVSSIDAKVHKNIILSTRRNLN